MGWIGGWTCWWAATVDALYGCWQAARAAPNKRCLPFSCLRLVHHPSWSCCLSSLPSCLPALPTVKFDGLMSEALGIDPLSGGFRDVPGGAWAAGVVVAGWVAWVGSSLGTSGLPCRLLGLACSCLSRRASDMLVPHALFPRPLPALLLAVYPPTVIVSMQRDKKQRELINENREILEGRNTPVEIIKVPPRDGRRAATWQRAAAGSQQGRQHAARAQPAGMGSAWRWEAAGGGSGCGRAVPDCKALSLHAADAGCVYRRVYRLYRSRTPARSTRRTSRSASRCTSLRVGGAARTGLGQQASLAGVWHSGHLTRGGAGCSDMLSRHVV